MYIVFLLLLVIYMFAVAAVIMFKENDPAHFGYVSKGPTCTSRPPTLVYALRFPPFDPYRVSSHFCTPSCALLTPIPS